MKDPAQLEREILASGNIHENILLMRDSLSRHFSVKDLQDLSLLDLCRLFCDLTREER